jgi:hypothetical protein
VRRKPARIPRGVACVGSQKRNRWFGRHV